MATVTPDRVNPGESITIRGDEIDVPLHWIEFSLPRWSERVLANFSNGPGQTTIATPTHRPTQAPAATVGIFGLKMDGTPIDHGSDGRLGQVTIVYDAE